MINSSISSSLVKTIRPYGENWGILGVWPMNHRYKCKSELSDLGPKWVRLAPNGTNSGTFPDKISVHFGSPSQNVLKSDLEKSRICLIWPNLYPNPPSWVQVRLPPAIKRCRWLATCSPYILTTGLADWDIHLTKLPNWRQTKCIWYFKR